MDAEKQNSKPPPPPWIDKDFIQRALRAGDGDPTLTVTSYEISMANAVGDGYATDIYRVIAKLQNSEERRVVVKCQPQGGIREGLMNFTSIFDKETRMLTKTFPAMHKLLNEARPESFQPFAAKCLYHGNDPVHFLVLEDLRQSGFTLARRELGLDLAHCSMAIKTLARFHASSLAILDQDPMDIKCYNNSLFYEDTERKIAPIFDKSLRVLAEEVSKWPGFEKYACKLKTMQNTFYDRTIESCKRKDDKFNVLLHGDPWTSNMMFKYNDGVPEDIRLVDFQTCHYSCVALDLQYFLHTCPIEWVRIHHMDSLVQEYYSELMETLDLLGVSGHMVTLPQLNKMLKDYAFYGLMTAVTLLPVVLSDPKDRVSLENVLSEGDDKKEHYGNIYSNSVYVKAMKRMLPLFEEQGAFDI